MKKKGRREKKMTYTPLDEGRKKFLSWTSGRKNLFW